MLSRAEVRLPRSTPEPQGVSSAAILEFVQAVERQIREVHSFMLLRHGSVIAEGWWSPYAPEHPHLMFSVSKSFTAMAVGLAIAEGRFTIDDPVLPFFLDDAPAEVSEHLAAMRIRDLLTMTTGHAVDTLAYMESRADGNWINAFFEVPVLHAPGTHFLYNTGATYLLSAIVERTTGLKQIDYLAPRLFAPLGIENARWQESPQGIAIGGYGLSLTTEDLAKFGQLCLQEGQWQGKQLVSEAWVEAATRHQVDNGDDPYRRDWTQGYGYQFWRSRHGTYRCDGVFGQFCIVMPEKDAVLVITAGTDIFDGQQVLDLVWDHLLPAMHSEPLPDDAVNQQALADKSEGLSLLPINTNVSAATAAQVSGRTYQVDDNALGLEALTLDFTATGCDIRCKTAQDDESFACGYGVWQHSRTTLFNDRRWMSDAPAAVAVCGTWITEDSFEMIVRLYETPFYHTLRYHFVGDELLIESCVNVSMESTKPQMMTARWV